MSLITFITIGGLISMAWCYIIAVTVCDESPEAALKARELWSRFRAWSRVPDNRRTLLCAAWFGLMVAVGLLCGLVAATEAR